jgi:hypothetical protein
MVRTLIGHGRGVAEVSAEARSGVALQAEMQGKHSKMAQLARGLQRWEQQTLNMVNRAGSNITVEYPKEFDVMALSGKIDSLIQLRQIKTNEIALKPVVKQVLQEVMNRVGTNSADMKKALDEIEKVPFEEQVSELDNMPTPSHVQVQGMQEGGSGGKE